MSPGSPPPVLLGWFCSLLPLTARYKYIYLPKYLEMKKRHLILIGIISCIVLVAIYFLTSAIEDLRSKPWLASQMALEQHNEIFCLIQETVDKDKCLSRYAYEFNNSNSCMKIDNAEKRDSCLISLLFLDNKIDCSNVQNGMMRSGCVVAKSYGIAETNISLNIDFDV